MGSKDRIHSVARACLFRASLLSSLIVIALAGTSSIACAQTPVPGTKPKAVVEAGTFEWGSVSQGTKVAHDFVLKNAGDAELIIQRIVPSCGCTATSTVTDHIPVGGQTNIHVEVDTAGFSGQKEKDVRLFTNDPDDPYSTVTLKGNVEPDVAIDPPRLVFPNLIRGEISQPPVLQFEVKVRDGSAVTIKDVTTFSKFLSLKELNAGDKARKVEVTLNPQVPNGEFRDRVIVGLNGAPVSAMNVPVIAAIRGQLELKPSTVSFGVIEGTTTITKHARLENAGQQPISIKSTSSDTDAVTTQFKVVKPGKIFDIQVDVDPRKVAKDLRASVTIETDSPTDGTLTLSVYGILPPKQ